MAPVEKVEKEETEARAAMADEMKKVVSKMKEELVEEEVEEQEEAEPLDDKSCDEKYAKALEQINGVDGKYDEAIDLLTEVLEYKCGKFGELAIECAPAFYNYGVALFIKARLENDVFGEPVQKAMVEKAISQMKQEAEKGSKNEEEEGEDVNKEEEAFEDDEEEDDMELAWRNLETARLIYTNQGGHEKEIADVYATLAELSMEREDFETSTSDFKSAIGVISNVPKCERILAEYHYKLCIALQLRAACQNQAQSAKDALLKESTKECQTAQSLLKSLAEEATEGGVKEELETCIEELQMKIEELSSQQVETNNRVGAPSSSSQMGFDAAQLGCGKENLGVVGRGVNRVSLAPVKKRNNVPPQAAAQEPEVKKQKHLS